MLSDAGAPPSDDDQAAFEHDVESSDLDDDDADADTVFHDEQEHVHATSPAAAWPGYTIAVIDAVYRCGVVLVVARRSMLSGGLFVASAI